MKRFLALVRAEQWYKNTLLFLPLIFGLHLFDGNAFVKTSIGFIAFCLVSSSNYILNDWHDLANDRIHPEKKKRPLSAGMFSVAFALLLAAAFLVVGIAIAVSLSWAFTAFVIAFFLLTQLYTFVLKDEAFADLLLISINFVIRASAGAFVIATGAVPYIRVSPWLILCTFFLALFLVTAKREADFTMLKGAASHHKKVFSVYTQELISAMLLIATSLLVASYSLYIFLSDKHYLFLSLPFALYTIFYYYFLIKSGSSIPRRPEQGYKDVRLVLGALLWTVSVIVIIYFF